METPPSPRPLKLRLLICNPKSYGAKNIVCRGLSNSGNIPRTREDPYLPTVFSYECKSFAEWEKLAEGISRQISNQNAFFARAHLVDSTLPPSPAARVDAVANGLYVAVPAETTFLERLVIELSELQARMGKLHTFLLSDKAGELDTENHRLLTEQYHHMEAYSHTLHARLARLNPPQAKPAAEPASATLTTSSPEAQTGGDFSSGRVGEAREESEPTFSADTSDTGAPVSEFDPVRSPESADTPESVEPTPDTAAATGAAATEEGDPPEAEPASKRAPAPAKPAAKKVAKKK
jgi:hypothetical protein